MTIKKKEPAKADSQEKASPRDFREMAEEVVRTQKALQKGKVEPISPAEAQRLLYELQVHQVELETQNEELRQTQIKLEASKARYFDLYELAPVGYLTVSATGVILEANLTAATLLGVGKADLINRQLSGFVCPDDQETFYRHCQTRAKSDAPQGCDLRMKRKDTGVFWTRLEVKPQLGIDGQREYLTILSDITRQKIAEEALQQSEARLSSIVEDQTELICRYLPGGKLTFVNDAYVRYLGRSQREILKHNIILNIPEPDLARVKELTRNITLQQPIADLEHRVILPNGIVRWQHWIHRGIFDARGSLVEFQAVGRDITERKIADAAREEIERLLLQSQKLESLEKMAGGIAHDFNNLLAIISLNLEAARQCLTSEVFQAHLGGISEATDRAAGLAQKMLDCSGRGHFFLKSLHLNPLIREVVNRYSSGLPATVTLEVDLDQTLPMMAGAEGQLEQLTRILLTNAAEALSEKPGTVWVKTRLLECTEQFLQAARWETPAAPGRYIALEVEDSGGGMDQETLTRLFEPFFSTKFIGWGLGLPVVLGIVRGHKGAIIVDTRPGRGTSIRVLFPVTETVAPVPVVEPSLPRASEATLKRKFSGTFLVIDDEPLICKLCSKQLEDLGFQVLTATSGLEGVELFRQHAQTVVGVLLDLTMPLMDGGKTFFHLRQIRPQIPVILTSGYIEEEALSRFGAEKPNRFIQKPFSLELLKEKIVGLLGDEALPR